NRDAAAASKGGMHVAVKPLPSQALLTAYLRDHDVPCPGCGYNLRNASAASCPECGLTVELGLQPRSIAAGPWVLAIVAQAAALGFAGTLSVVGAIGSQRSAYWSNEDWTALALLVGITLLHALASAAFYRWRTAILNRRRVQWTLA